MQELLRTVAGSFLYFHSVECLLYLGHSMRWQNKTKKEKALANQQQPFVTSPNPNDIEKLYPSMEDTMNQNQQNYNYMQKPYAPMNQNPVMNLYPSAEETQGVKEEDYNMPPPAVDNN